VAVVTVASFASFANLVVAACKLASDPDPVARLKALADIATGGRALDAALGTTGLAAVAQEMARTAEDHARHFTHPGPARDDAIALFWQVAPAVFADPATFAAAHLDPALTADRMVAAIKASPIGRDFTAAPLPGASHSGRPLRPRTTPQRSAEAGLSQLLDAAVDQYLLAFDAEGAARQIEKRIKL
jgi:hypothetical protein